MLAPRDSRHGVLVDVLGLGVLMIGESGIGKSECALELIRLGHRLVSDDVVDVRRRGGAIVIGTCPPLTRHHMELRGIGLINVRDLFGVTATRTSKRVELVVKLERWDPSREYERLGLDETFEDVLGVPIASVCMARSLGTQRSGALSVTFLSFGFKYGLPLDADLVFDVRFLPNPHFVARLREKTGRDRPVVQFLDRFEDTGTFLEKVADLLQFLIPRYAREGKSYLTVAIGCTGGRHRSVAIAEALAKSLRGLTGVRLRVKHRDVANA